MPSHIRKHIGFSNTTELNEFISILNKMDRQYNYVIENFDCTYRVDARSILGVMYMFTENYAELYLVNLTKDGEFPATINQFAVL